MAVDRLVYWQDSKPTDQQLLQVLEEFLGGAGRISGVTTTGGARSRQWWTVKLPGRPSNPLRRVFAADGAEGLPNEERWFEVYVDERCVDVMTCLQDAFVNALAEKFADAICGAWNGRREDFVNTRRESCRNLVGSRLSESWLRRSRN
jgi:hypothetical protein